ncbi:AraC family transcriptional regulator [Psychromonas ossibalaenae]|uniref:AraC family transcriptional regulator n=1 Tax=Psychromonas ossibalaenae TaxID=444922 RepID=UPI0003650ED3|nr:AraC family transcriptional regulator [Psychromonas ossibalaenae]
MKATIEKVPQRLGMSWRYKKITESDKPCDWHFHQEFELVLHRHFTGQVFIGHYQGNIEHNHLLLIAPDIAHTFNSIGNTGKHCETHVFWFKRRWIEDMMFNCVELRKLDALLKRAQKGLLFSAATAEKVFELADKMLNISAIGQLTILLQVLDTLCNDKNCKSLLSFSAAPKNKLDKTEKEKIEKICCYIEDNFHNPIRLSDLAEFMYSSESTIHRIFEQHFSENFGTYLKKLRLNHAAELLTSSNFAVSLIAEKVGYRNQANFNRQFKLYKNLTPRAYRSEFKLAVKV